MVAVSGFSEMVVVVVVVGVVVVTMVAVAVVSFFYGREWGGVGCARVGGR